MCLNGFAARVIYFFFKRRVLSRRVGTKRSQSFSLRRRVAQPGLEGDGECKKTQIKKKKKEKIDYFGEKTSVLTFKLMLLMDLCSILLWEI